MTTFWAKSEMGQDGKPRLNFGEGRDKVADDLRKNPGARYKLERDTPESRKQRGFFEGGLVPLAVYFQEALDTNGILRHVDYHVKEDCDLMRDLLKIEAGVCDAVKIKNKIRVIPKSSKGRKNLRQVLDFTVDWLRDECGCPEYALDTKNWKHYRDAIRPDKGMPDNYIDYLRLINILK